MPGHWEGDLITGTENKSAIGTLVERTTGFLMLLHLPQSHGADAVATAMTQAMSRLPETLRKTLTWDQGIEMRNHAQIAAATDLDIYFCDPHSPWQRGSNENTACCASTSPKAPTSRPTQPTTSNTSPASSTTDHAND